MGAFRLLALVVIFGVGFGVGPNAFCCSAKEFLSHTRWIVGGRSPLNVHYGESFYRQHTNWKAVGDSSAGKLWSVVGRFYYRGVRALVHLHSPTRAGKATVEVKIFAGPDPENLEPLIARDLLAVQRANRGVSIPKIERIAGEEPKHFRIVFEPESLPPSTWYLYGLQLTLSNGYLAFPEAPPEH